MYAVFKYGLVGRKIDAIPVSFKQTLHRFYLHVETEMIDKESTLYSTSKACKYIKKVIHKE